MKPPPARTLRAAEGDVFLQPGQYHVGSGCTVRTLLGSCVSITLWQPQRRIGAMSHFLLWSRGRAARQPDGRYGDEVMALMLQELQTLGVRGEECEGKLFGGGDMFPDQSGAGAGGGLGTGIGQRNGSAARQQLQRHGIRLVSECLFGAGHRQIAFDLSTGRVRSRQMSPKRLLWPITGHGIGLE